ncbi:MAG TPA: hypothetical protein VHE30_07990 [Polyangiaceae bacterium]|nr:hypothetical protein [Polyangiaceae bacterium]
MTIGGAVTAAPECLTSSGKTACGYHCLASDGDVRCSQSPDGVCSATSGVVTCWDPPPLLRRMLGSRLPKPSCESISGQTACGYACQTNSDHVACAQTPFGACGATDGKLVCWDPPGAVVATLRAGTPLAECITNSGKIACGYHCQAYDGVVRCAQTPQGTCSVEQSHLVCWDPPVDSSAPPYEPESELACLDGADGRTCGYRCLATKLHSACGTKRDQTCRTVGDGIACKAPE